MEGYLAWRGMVIVRGTHGGMLGLEGDGDWQGDTWRDIKPGWGMASVWKTQWNIGIAVWGKRHRGCDGKLTSSKST